MHTKRPSRHVIRSLLSFAIASWHLATGASDTEHTDGESEPTYEHIEELIAVGTRHQSRSHTESVVPVDLFTENDLDSVHSSDMIEVLSHIVPSFSVRRHPISDGASFVRPTHVRNLEPHHTLVLVNHKRRHKAAFMQVGGWGAHGSDIGALPSIAIKSVEVLRDGAAAQYGSDAIAGVINFNLRESIGESMLRARLGQYGVGDGTETILEGYIGRDVTSNGYITASFQLADAEPTSRSQHYDISIAGTGVLPHEAVDAILIDEDRTYYGPDAYTYVYDSNGTLISVTLEPDGVPDDLDTSYRDHFESVGGNRLIKSPAQIWGRPTRRQHASLVNFGLNDVGHWDIYGFANYTTKDQTGGFFYRRPGISVFHPVRLQDGSIFDVRQSFYPAGFTPQFSGFSKEVAFSVGVQRELGTDWVVDLSLNSGRSLIEYSIANTLNPSLGPQSPTSFRPGDLANQEVTLNADFTGTVQLGSIDPVSLALGIERRAEQYEIKAGDPASYELGPFGSRDPFNLEITQAEVDSDPNDELTMIECRIPGLHTIGSLCPTGDPINNTLPIGSNGFPGYSPLYATIQSRNSYGLYLDGESSPTADLLVNGALRFENFEDFGDIVVWKLAAKFRASRAINLRGSMGTGFRAPSTGQLSTTNVSTRIAPDGSPEAVGLFPATHPASMLFGSNALLPERSTSFTFGVTINSSRFGDITLDTYSTDIDHRLILASGFEVGPAERVQLVELAVPGALDIGRVSFFTNDVNTRTTGVDLTGYFQFDTRFGTTSLSWLTNFNQTEITRRGTFIDDEGVFDIENGTPSRRTTVTATNTWRIFDFLIRVREYGPYKNANNATLQEIQSFNAEYFVDVASTISFNNGMQLEFGVENVFDNYPARGQFESCCGRIYRSDSIVPWQGSLFYLQLEAPFGQ